MGMLRRAPAPGRHPNRPRLRCHDRPDTGSSEGGVQLEHPILARTRGGLPPVGGAVLVGQQGVVVGGLAGGRRPGLQRHDRGLGLLQAVHRGHERRAPLRPDPPAPRPGPRPAAPPPAPAPPRTRPRAPPHVTDPATTLWTATVTALWWSPSICPESCMRYGGPGHRPALRSAARPGSAGPPRVASPSRPRRPPRSAGPAAPRRGAGTPGCRVSGGRARPATPAGPR